MTIKNQVGRTSFDLCPPEWIEGLVLEGNAFGWPLPYPERRSTWTVAFTGDPGDGTYGATLVGPSGELVPIEVERDAGDPASNTLLAAAFAAAVLADVDAVDHVYSADASTGTVTIAFRSPGMTYSVTDVLVPDAVAQVNTYTIESSATGDFTIEINEEPFTESVPAAVAPVAQIVEYTIADTAVGDYTITLNGEPFTESVVAQTVEQIRDALIVTINGGAEPVTATAGVGTDKLRVTADVAGTAFTTAVASPSDHLSQATIAANVVEVVPQTETEIRDALVATINGGAEPVTAAPVSTDKLTVTADVAGTAFVSVIDSPSDTELTEVETTDNVSATLTATQTQAPNGGAIAFGRFVVKATIDGKSAVRLPEAGDVAGDIVGVTARTHATLARPASAEIDDEPTYLPGDTITPIERLDGCMVLRNVGNVAAVIGGAVYAVIDDATDEFGQARADGDSGNAVAPTKFSAKWLTNTPAGALGLVSLR